MDQRPYIYRPHPKDGEGNVFSLSTSGGGGGQVSPAGVSILRPLASGMPLAFTQEDFLVVNVGDLAHTSSMDLLK